MDASVDIFMGQTPMQDSDLEQHGIDLFQFHQVQSVPDPDDPEGAYAGALEAKRRGWM